MGDASAVRVPVSSLGGRNPVVASDGSPVGRAYPILRFSEIPPIDIELMDEPDETSLGMGECTMGPTAAAIANAAAHALGLRIRDMPLSRARTVAAAGAG